MDGAIRRGAMVQNANPKDSALHRFLLIPAGLAGALGVAAPAARRPRAPPHPPPPAQIALFHAPALIGLSLYRGSRLAGIAGWVLVIGVAMFAGDLVMRAQAGTPLFPMAAPIGGGTMILGWLLVAGAAAFGPKAKP